MESELITPDVVRLVVDGGWGAQEVLAWTHFFEEREKKLKPWDIKTHQSFDFSYAMTVHKAQGSEWPNVLVIDESAVFRGDARKWLYTAITRACESTTIVRS